MKIFYVCSYGGCGSTILSKALKKYGKVFHIHSRKPPNKLEFVGGKKTYNEWFNGKKIPVNQINNYRIIYIYKNPINSILSRFTNPNHLQHIQTNKNTKIIDLLKTEKDLYGIKEFYNNYTKKNEKRNYKILCIKYEDLFENQNILSKILNIGPLNMIKKEKKRNLLDDTRSGAKYIDNEIETINKLKDIYSDLIKEMNNNKFLFIS
jgi:hypothetical protein